MRRSSTCLAPGAGVSALMNRDDQTHSLPFLILLVCCFSPYRRVPQMLPDEVRAGLPLTSESYPWTKLCLSTTATHSHCNLDMQLDYCRAGPRPLQQTRGRVS